MKILLLNDFAEKTGGAETYFYSLSELLNSHGHKTQNYFSKEKVRSVIFGSIFSIKHFIRIYKKIKAEDPDVIHIHKYNLSLSPTPLIAAKLLKKKTAITFHDFGMLCCNGWCVDKKGNPCKDPTSIRWIFKKSLSKKSLSKKIYDYIKNKIHISIIKRNADICIGPSKAMADYLKNIFKKNKVCHLPYFKDIEKEDIDTINKTNHEAVFIGRISKEKGASLLIKSFKKVVENIPDAKLIIVGDGEEKNNLEKLAKDLDIEKNIIFKGILKKKDMNNLYKNTSMVVLSSIWMENNPLVIYESMAHSIPLIGTNIGGIPDMIKDNINGYLIERFDTDALAKKMITLMKNKKDAVKMGKKGKEILKKNFNSKDHLDKLMKLYKSVK